MSDTLTFLGQVGSEQAANTAADIEQAALRDFHRYWDERRGGARWPPRSAIDPLDLKPLLGSLVIVDVLHDGGGAPPRFRYRLFGSSLVQWFGFDMTGKTIDDWPGAEYGAYLNASYREVVAAARPFRRKRSIVKDNRILRYESLMLPLGRGERIEQVIAAQQFFA